MPDQELQEQAENAELRERIRESETREEYNRLQLEQMRRAVKREYGPNWRGILGLGGMRAKDAIVAGYNSLRRSKGALQRTHGRGMQRF